MTSSLLPPGAHAPRHACVRAAAFAIASLTLASSAPLSAQAPVNCNEIPGAIIGVGGSAGTPFIKSIAVEIEKAKATNPAIDVTVVYSDPGACRAMDGVVKDLALTGTAKYWDASGTEKSCTFPSGANIKADWGSMAQTAGTCQGTTLPDSVADEQGPVTGLSLVAPTSSSNYSISADALYFIYGFGVDKAPVGTWSKVGSIGSRSNTSAAGLLLAKAAGLPADRPLLTGTTANPGPYVDVKDNQGAINYVTATSQSAVADPESALAFCSTETVESGANRQKVRTLAFQARGQKVAFFPDSSDTATDKKNLREGRYYLWATHHFFYRKSASDKVKQVISYFTGKSALPAGKSYLDVVIDNNTIPQCAMKVSRELDMGPLSPYQPEEPCGCYFDAKKGVESSCTPCTDNTQCGNGAPVCRHGFCEVK